MSASDKSERPEVRAFQELELLVRGLGEELASFRRRAIDAEAQLKAPLKAKLTGRAAEVETENEGLKTRLGRAEDRVKQMLDRVRFLRQQLQTQAGGRS
jgi:hypothetical protein